MVLPESYIQGEPRSMQGSEARAGNKMLLLLAYNDDIAAGSNSYPQKAIPGSKWVSFKLPVFGGRSQTLRKLRGAREDWSYL